MDGLGDLATRGVLLGLAAFLLVAAGRELALTVRDVRLLRAGRRVEATVTAVTREWVAGEAVPREWVHVGFSTEQGERLEAVRLRHWARVAPQLGARVPISYHPEEPTTADRALVRRVLGRLLVSVPLTLATAALVAAAGAGLLDRWLRP